VHALWAFLPYLPSSAWNAGGGPGIRSHADTQIHAYRLRPWTCLLRQARDLWGHARNCPRHAHGHLDGCLWPWRAATPARDCARVTPIIPALLTPLHFAPQRLRSAPARARGGPAGDFSPPSALSGAQRAGSASLFPGACPAHWHLGAHTIWGAGSGGSLAVTHCPPFQSIFVQNPYKSDPRIVPWPAQNHSPPSPDPHVDLSLTPRGGAVPPPCHLGAYMVCAPEYNVRDRPLA
jgi:hypothetical protein